MIHGVVVLPVVLQFNGVGNNNIMPLSTSYEMIVN